MVAAIAPSSMNGSWMNRFDAPTRRMIPVSRRRLIADSRMVVVMSSDGGEQHDRGQAARRSASPG